MPLGRWFAGNQIRNVSALGGNIVTGSPISDLNPVWMASNATFTVASAERGCRDVPASHFFLGYRTVDMKPDEILLKVGACCARACTALHASTG